MKHAMSKLLHGPANIFTEPGAQIVFLRYDPIQLVPAMFKIVNLICLMTKTAS